jgi:hypothetical protein
MRKPLLFLTLAVSLFGTAIAQAAVVPSCSATTLDVLIALKSGGCQSQDKIFSNFSYSALSGSDPASAIKADLIFRLVRRIRG